MSFISFDLVKVRKPIDINEDPDCPWLSPIMDKYDGAIMKVENVNFNGYYYMDDCLFREEWLTLFTIDVHEF